MNQGQKLYEMSYLISPAYSEEEAGSFHQKLKSQVQELGGLVDAEGNVAKRRLSYPIKKMGEAYLAHFRFTADPEAISKLKTNLESKEVLRYLLVGTRRAPPPPLRIRRFGTTSVEKAVPMVKTERVSVTRELQPAADIEAIDKKLEEILGK